MSRFWQASNVLKRQANRPQYLTDGCCESVLDKKNGLKVFKELNLPFSSWRQEGKFGSFVDYKPTHSFLPKDAEFYPLTDKESDYIGEDSFGEIHAGIRLPNSMLYQGKKYLAPSIEVCWFDGKTFSRGSYGPCLYATKKEAKTEAERLAEFLKPKLVKFGGLTYIDEEVDRFDVFMLIPFSKAFKYREIEKWKEFLGNLVKGYTPLPFTGAEK